MEIFGISVVHIALAILMSVFTSWITVKFALGKFQKEKLWERKLDAYQKIIESLHKIKKSYDSDYNDQITGSKKNYSKEELEEEHKELKSALDEVEKFTEIGSLIISKESVKILNQYKKRRLEFHSSEEGKYGNYFIFLDGITSDIKWCLEKIIPVAQKDLSDSFWKKLVNKLPCCLCKN